MAQLMARRPALAREAEALLGEIYAETKASLVRHVLALQAVTDALLARKSLLGADTSALLTPDSDAVSAAPAVRLATVGQHINPCRVILLWRHANVLNVLHGSGIRRQMRLKTRVRSSVTQTR